MLTYAAGLLAGDREAAEDAIDEAFLDIWKSAASYAGRGDAQGWIRRIVRNKAFDWLRKQKRRTQIVSDAYLADFADPAKDPEETAINSSDAQWLRRHLACLNPEQREAVILSYYEGLSVFEISQIAGCPENTVKTRLFHARKILAKQLDPYSAKIGSVTKAAEFRPNP